MLLDYLASLFAPFCCVGCGTERDKLLCDACKGALPRVSSCCYQCKATTRHSAVCSTCKRKTPLRQVAVFTHHEGLARELLHVSKYERAKAGLYEIAEMMAELLPLFSDEFVITSVPTASSRVRERGYDQAEVIAKKIASLGNVHYSSLLRRLGQAHQVGSGRSERIRHVSGAFRTIHEEQIKGAHILLVDDVCTTGATLEEAAKTLKKAGAKRVDALVYSQPN